MNQQQKNTLYSCGLFCGITNSQTDSLLGCLKLPEYEKETCTVLGPAPCPVPKINYHYRYRLMLHGSFDRPMRRLTAHLLRQFSLDKANRGVSAFVDVNGSND